MGTKPKPTSTSLILPDAPGRIYPFGLGPFSPQWRGRAKEKGHGALGAVFSTYFFNRWLHSAYRAGGYLLPGRDGSDPDRVIIHWSLRVAPGYKITR
jgi:hypothetical protein